MHKEHQVQMMSATIEGQAGGCGNAKQEVGDSMKVWVERLHKGKEKRLVVREGFSEKIIGVLCVQYYVIC